VLLNASAVHDRSGKLLYVLAQVHDMTEHKQAEQRLAKAAEDLRDRATELERSNADLQQFAYVASHDLSEPLRMVSSYVQLLARRYRGRLDSDADEFIRFAVDGASRMQALIDGLLLYSRTGTLEYTHGPIDCSKVMASTLSTMDRRVKSTGAVITIDPLPTVTGDETQLGQLFQNLLSNALKFVSDRQPRIHVSAVRDGPGWLFSITDNGIGIEPRHTERIFKVFQRLHNHESYSGSGIGLAICKRIVERHGGRIWVDPVPAGGTRFSFTIPDRGLTADETSGPSHER
jgi:light-regulated signal transduction histidine kinase (bacteriophytochrome)